MMYQIIIELYNIKWSEKHEYIRVFAGIEDWYIVQIEGDYVGVVSKKYIKPIYSNFSNNTSGRSGMTTSTTQLKLKNM